jgi:hypothetical protein
VGDTFGVSPSPSRFSTNPSRLEQCQPD